MDQAIKLGRFYQYQIAKIAELTRKQPSRSSRKRLDNLRNQYIDMLLAMSGPTECTTGVQASAVLAAEQRRHGPVLLAQQGTHQR